MSTQILIIASYFAVLVAIGINSKKHLKSSLAFQGVGLGVLMSASASAGEWLGGTSTIGVSEYGFDFGISGSWYTIANGIGMIFLALFFAKLYRSMESVTIPGIIGKLLGRQARTWSSVFLIFVMLAVGTSQMISAGSLGMTLFSLDFVTVVIASTVIFIAMTLSGGMIAIAKTHTLHLVSLYGGAILAIILSLGRAGGSGKPREGIARGSFRHDSYRHAKDILMGCRFPSRGMYGPGQHSANTGGEGRQNSEESFADSCHRCGTLRYTHSIARHDCSLAL